jgi:hypothetical protein
MAGAGMLPSAGTTGVNGSTAVGGAATVGSTGMAGNAATSGNGGSSNGTGGGAAGMAGASAGAAGSGMLPASGVEDGGVSCAKPTLPAASALTPHETHQDPFTMLSGSRITKKSEWACRRAEIKAQVEEYESGPKPVVPKDSVTAQFANDKLTVTVENGDKSVSFSVDIKRPPNAGAGPSPLLIGVGGNFLGSAVFDDNGVAQANFNNNGVGDQNGKRGVGSFYTLYGQDHPASSMIAWAWGVSRIIDALEKTPAANIDPKRIAVTGCSRNGKGALTVGAFDERIALTIPQESGAGGSASWRVSQAASNSGENVQTLSNAASEQPWFRASFGSTFGGSKVTTLPFDHHMVMGLVAPRALLVIDNRIDWLGIDSTFTAGSIAHGIWEGLGVPDTMGYWQLGGHDHCSFPAAQTAMLAAYVKKFLVGGGTDDTKLLKSDGAKADLAKWMKWTPAQLQ